MLLIKTPYRISLFGGGSDYPSYYIKHGGACLSAAIDKYCWLLIRKPAKFGHPFRAVYSKLEECSNIRSISHPAIRVVLQRLGIERAEIYHSSDLPARSGVGSSSAFVVGLLKAFTTLKGEEWTKEKLAEEAEYIERIELRETVGSQDQHTCSLGGVNLLRFDSWGVKICPVLCDDNHSLLKPLEDRLLLFYTGVQRTASDVAISYVGDLSSHHNILSRLVEMSYVGRRILQEVAYNGKPELDEIGEMLDEAWQLKKSLSPNISNSQLDSIYTTAKNSGASGGKLLGAGGGGHFLFYVKTEKQEEVRQALTGMGLTEVELGFDWNGSTVVYREES